MQILFDAAVPPNKQLPQLPQLSQGGFAVG